MHLIKELQLHSDLATPGGAGLSQLVPPYATMAAWAHAGAECTPLGTILHGAGPSALGVLGSVALALRFCPWLLPVITLPPNEERLEPLVDMIGELRDRVAITRHACAARLGTVAAVIDAARRRPLPRPDTMSRYAAIRLGAPELLEPLTEQFGRALGAATETTRSVATYSRLFARHGRYTARDWRTVARLAHDLCGRPPRPAPASDDSGWHAIGDLNTVTSFRTANRHARHLLGVSLAVAGGWLGWEWVLEQALRRGGYVSLTPTAYRH